MEMLSEVGSLSESSQWRKVKGGMDRDPRYRAVSGGSSQREEWFKEYIRSLAARSKVCGFTAEGGGRRGEIREGGRGTHCRVVCVCVCVVG